VKSIFLILSICSCLLPAAISQPKSEFTKPDNIARTAPDSAEWNPGTLASYFQANLTNQRDLARAAYCWTATHIAYDVAGMYTTNVSDNPAAIILKTMGDRKAVCQGYAEVFHELCARCGITSYVIHGYTRQNGNIGGLPHAWVVAVIDSNWYFFDPTWAAGYIENAKFVKRFTGEYFMVTPQKQIRSHMPYDPIWQCLNHPFNSSDFYNGKLAANGDSTWFSFPDSISAFLSLSGNEQNVATLRRVEKNGIVNNTLLEYARYLRHNIDVYNINQEIDARNKEVARQRKVVDRFNQAANHYNRAVSLFNDYINYYNRQFKPAKPDSEIRMMIDTCDHELKRAGNMLATLPPGDENLRENIVALSGSILDMEKKVNDQQLWLRNYFSTSKPFRSGQFKKYTFFGVPVN
jgi:transglutaminase/protease-like cytokinesis protein 3